MPPTPGRTTSLIARQLAGINRASSSRRGRRAQDKGIEGWLFGLDQPSLRRGGHRRRVRAAAARVLRGLVDTRLRSGARRRRISTIPR